MPAIVLEARELSKAYAGPPLFSALSVRVERGLTVVAGSNGSGKTTLLKILGSLLRPDQGSVRVLGAGRELPADERRRAVGWCGPDLAFYEDFTASENLAFFRRAAGMPADAADLARRLSEVGLGISSRLRLKGFSTGMTQRLRIAFALLFDSPILLLDEPFAALDEEGRARVAAIVRERRRGGAVVLASNDPRDFAGPDQVVELGARREPELS